MDDKSFIIWKVDITNRKLHKWSALFDFNFLLKKKSEWFFDSFFYKWHRLFI